MSTLFSCGSVGGCPQCNTKVLHDRISCWRSTHSRKAELHKRVGRMLSSYKLWAIIWAIICGGQSSLTPCPTHSCDWLLVTSNCPLRLLATLTDKEKLKLLCSWVELWLNRNAAGSPKVAMDITISWVTSMVTDRPSFTPLKQRTGFQLTRWKCLL